MQLDCVALLWQSRLSLNQFENEEEHQILFGFDGDCITLQEYPPNSLLSTIQGDIS